MGWVRKRGRSLQLRNVPYSAMMPNISSELAQHAQLNRARMACASVGSFLSMGLAMPLISLLGGGNEASGFLTLGSLFCMVVMALNLLCFSSTKERIQLPSVPFSLSSLDQVLQKSQPWVLYCLVQLFHYLAVCTHNSSTMFYAKYVLGDSEFASVLLATSSVTGFFGAFLAPPLAKRLSKRAISITGYALCIWGSFMIYAAGKVQGFVFILNILTSLGISLSGSVPFLILGETIDHTEYVTGVRQHSLLISMSMFMVKLEVMLSSALSVFVLDLGGYVPDQPQTSTALTVIQSNFIFLPAIAAAVCLVLFMFYRLDQEYPAIKEALERKRKEEWPYV